MAKATSDIVGDQPRIASVRTDGRPGAHGAGGDAAELLFGLSLTSRRPVTASSSGQPLRAASAAMA